MLTVTIFRHAKSSWDDPDLTDEKRPLAPRGREAAPLMGGYMKDTGIMPDTVLCSTAVRACQTLELALPHLASDPEVHYEDEIYCAGSRCLLRRIRDLPKTTRHVMIVGHNPAMHDLALELSETESASNAGGLSQKFPTGALAMIEFGAENWRDIEPGAGHLTHFMRPKALVQNQ